MKVLCDIDGVLANFVMGAYTLHDVPNPYLKEENLGSYWIQKLMGIPGPEFWEKMDEEFWTNLPLLPDAKEIIAKLEHGFGKENICLLTSPVRTPGCIRGKMNWIHKHFPQFDRQFLIGPMKEMCAHSNSILIDDYVENIRKFKQAGGNTFLLPRAWNLKHKEHTINALINFLGGKSD